jgi:hypothetical protein
MRAIVLVLIMATPAAAQESVTFAWEAGAGATGYYMEVGAAPGATFNTVDVGGQLGTRVDFAAPGTFYVRVRSYNSLGMSTATSNELAVSIAAPPPPPPPPPTDPCATTPLAVVVSTWPTKKAAAIYTASQPIADVTWLTRRNQQVYGAAFTDIRGCSATVLK